MRVGSEKAGELAFNLGVEDAKCLTGEELYDTGMYTRRVYV